MVNLIKKIFGRARKDKPISAAVGRLALIAYKKREAFLRLKLPGDATAADERERRAYALEQARAEMIEANQNLRKAQGFVRPRTPPPWPTAARAAWPKRT